MERYLQDLFEKDDIGFKTINAFKDNTKKLVLILNTLIEKRGGKNITLVEMNTLIGSLNLDKQMVTKMKLLVKKPTSNTKNQVGGWNEHITIDPSYLTTVNSINNMPCSGSLTQCGDFIASCGQTGGGNISDNSFKKNKDSLEISNRLMFDTTLDQNRSFEISDINKNVFYKIVKLYTSK
tara:strand:- start:147 stop:686 length:540 start_codon:yes stop_codon:yes gene_type:complete